METSKNLFKELENAEKLFSNGSIKSAQKIIRNAIKDSKSLPKIPNKLRHKLNAAINKSKYFDEISAFATNPKRDDLITKINHLITEPLKNPKNHAHAIHEIQKQWQLLDISSKPASRAQWLKFNELTNKAWETCKEYFDEIKQIKINNAKERENIIKEIYLYVESNIKKWPDSKKLITYLRNISKKWQTYAPVLDDDLNRLKESFYQAKKPINDEIKKQEIINKEKKEILINKVVDINNEDNQICINEFKKLKNEWVKIGPAGKKNDKNLWDKFNKNADRFFAEKKQIINDEILIIKDLNKQLINGDKSISDINNELSKLQHSKNTNEFKKINSDLNKEMVKLKNNKKKEKIEIYSNIYNALLESSATDPIPNIFLESIKTSHANKKSNIKELSYACIKLEVLAGLKSLKKDAELRNSVQLELLSSKFNKNINSITNDIDSILEHFIIHFSFKDQTKTHQNLWKRINKCFEVLL